MKIIVGTKNQKKIDVAVSVFKSVLSNDDVVVEGYDANSKVPESPQGQEIYTGALNRAIECYNSRSADFYVGMESGHVERYGNMFEEAWAVVVSGDGTQRIGYSSGLLLPKVVVGRMMGGQTHDEIMAGFDKEFNLPDDNKDTWSRYTGGNISRQVSLEEALRNALIQMVSSERNLYEY